jgi:hypothetical protein
MSVAFPNRKTGAHFFWKRSGANMVIENFRVERDSPTPFPWGATNARPGDGPAPHPEGEGR